tara:strand:+ start:13 stop:183 length:171 start_codon:yes stop_codon:yes gene_type:complete
MGNCLKLNKKTETDENPFFILPNKEDYTEINDDIKNNKKKLEYNINELSGKQSTIK